MTTFEHQAIKRAFDVATALIVAPLGLSYDLRRRLIGSERAYLELSERASRWPGVRGERMRNALHSRLGTELGEAVLMRFGCILKRPPLSIGRMTALGHYVVVQHASIGEHCVVGDHVLIADGRRQHNIDRLDVPINAQGIATERVHIGGDCWIGSHATILADVGDHCVVGAGSVVIEPVPDYMIVAGNPARVIGDRRERSPR
jgi:acetyltransferase-like isoleucine patch superfamily enzyme